MKPVKKRTVEITITLPEVLCEPLPMDEAGNISPDAWAEAERALMDHLRLPLPPDLCGTKEARSIGWLLLMVQIIPAFRAVRRDGRPFETAPDLKDQIALVEAVERECERAACAVETACANLIAHDTRAQSAAKKLIPERWRHLTNKSSLRKKYNKAVADIERLSLAAALAGAGPAQTKPDRQSREEKARTVLRQPSKPRLH